MNQSVRSALAFTALITASSVSEAQSAIAKQVHDLFAARCYKCHGDPETKPGGGLDYILDFKKLRESEVVDLKQPENSVLYDYIATGYMPLKDQALSANEVRLVLEWLKIGAPDAAGSAPAEGFISMEEEAAIIKQDLLKAAPSQRRSLPLPLTDSSSPARVDPRKTQDAD